MTDTSMFRTRTEFLPRVFPTRNGAWNVGLDIGYSGVKAISPNGAIAFPAYAAKMPDGYESLKEDAAEDIYYRDESGTWYVGEGAYAQAVPSSGSGSEAGLFGRSRYYSTMFRVVALTGLALACTANQCGSPGERKLAVQTGLPPEYEKADAPFLRDVLAGRHRFEVKAMGRGWKAYDITLAEKDISVMAQPKGTLVSASMARDGTQAPIARDLFSSNVIIPDTGFGTFDVFTLTHGVVTGQETFPDLGMREVFSRTCRDIMDEFGTEVSVTGLQNYLKKGTVPVLSPKDRRRENRGFAEILGKNCADVCRETVETIMNLHYYCRDTDYIIPTGGAYDAWRETFDAEFKDMDGLKVVPGNANDASLGNVFSNVRGFYFNLAMRKGGA